VDAFAGAGRAQARSAASDEISEAFLELGREFRGRTEVGDILNGSPRVALDVEPPFTHYVFLELDERRGRFLQSLKAEYRTRRKIVVREQDCNRYLVDLAENRGIDWGKWRGIVFLDPFGMQVRWRTIAALAKTRGLEVFLNFPIGMAIQRLLRRDAKFTDRGRRKLDEYFGDPGWFDVVYPKTQGLFGPQQAKAGDAERRLVLWYGERLGEIFGYVSHPYLMRNTRGGHLYFLIFAGPNKTGKRIADDVLKGGFKI